MGSMVGMLAFYQAFVLPSIALSTFLVGYLILRYRDREDAELGYKALFSYLQIIAMQVVLFCVASVLTMLISESFSRMAGSGSAGWRSIVGIAAVNAGLWVLFGKLLAKTDIEAKPAARKLFEGFGTATTLIITMIAASLLGSGIVGWQEGNGDFLKVTFAFTAVYGGATFLLLKKQGISVP